MSRVQQLPLMFHRPGVTFFVVGCRLCNGKGSAVADVDPDFACGRCLGTGWHWNDRRPATRCPQTVKRSTLKEATLAACDRRLERCPGCERPATMIGNGFDFVDAVWQVGRFDLLKHRTRS